MTDAGQTAGRYWPIDAPVVYYTAAPAIGRHIRCTSAANEFECAALLARYLAELLWPTSVKTSVTG
jgi:hypothetical protein